MEGKLWTKGFISVTVTNFFLMLIFYLLVVTISVFAVDKFGSTESEAGLVVGIFVIVALIGRLFTGRYIEIFGRKKVLYLGLILNAISSFFYFFCDSYLLLMFNRILHGFSFGVTATATGTIVAQFIPTKKKGEGIGYFALSMTLGTAIGPFIGIYILEHYDYSVLFWFCLICSLVSLILAYWLKVTEITLSEDDKLALKSFKLANFIEKQSLPIAFVVAIAAFCYSGILSFLTFFAKEIQLTDVASFFFIVYSIAIFVSRPLTGRLFDRKGPSYVLYPALIIFIIGMFVLSEPNSGVMLLLAGAVIGVGYGNYISSGQTVAIMSVPAQRTGIATSTFFICTDFGVGIAPFILGLIVPITAYSGLYFLLAFLLIACLPLQYFLSGRKA